NLGNTVVLVEHDREVLEASDRLYDFGPGAGRLGGTIVGQGTPKQLSSKKSKSLTGQYLGDHKAIPIPSSRRMDSVHEARRGDREKGRRGEKNTTENGRRTTGHKNWLELTGARQHNLRDVDLRIPLGTFTCVTGVSGSGKSTLIEDTLAKAVARQLHRTHDQPAPFDELLGLELVNKIIRVDQQPLGNTPASNPATYVGVFDHIRDLFAQLPEARVRGYRPARFSFNRKGGRCEDCEGNGQKCIEMHFLPDVWVECDTCRGKRYNHETLTVKYRGYSIADVLEMPVSKALEVFANVPKIRAPLATLAAIGLDYLTLGQSAPTLSGGESQRIKLAAELAKPNRGRTLYLLDEPTTGLHFDDILKLLTVLNSLVEQGNSVVVIEHNLDVIKTADWIVDIGPEAGGGGGQIVVQGTPEDVVRYTSEGPLSIPARSGRRKPGRKMSAPASSTGSDVRSQAARSWTGEMLTPVLAESTTGTIAAFDVKAAATKRDTDVTIEQLGKSALLPWEEDGPKWHLHDRIAHSGQPCRWDGKALKLVVDLLSRQKTLADVNWNHRSTVEVKAKTGTGWFLHARTGGEWLLSLCFRVRKNTFTGEGLDRQLGLLPLDERDDIPAYGREPRVRVRNLKTPWQEVTVKVWNREEIDNDAFRQFLDTAVAGFLKQSQAEKANPDDLMPWKQLGRKWHLMRKALPKNGRIPWQFDLLETLLATVEQLLTGTTADYGIRSKINWNRSDGTQVAELYTKRYEGVDLVLLCPHDSVTIGAIADFGMDQEIKRHRDGRDAVRIRFTTVAQCENEGLQKFLAETGATIAKS
ncbi:MAG: ATP-binding cassette domain-containing protein, partial [Planctomycetaceae bacterium]|nr:ATP-binding cassette domain-containing protein [Planctomycetaceae bacterium]